MKKLKLAENLISFIDKSPCSYYTTDNIKNILEENDFIKIDLSEKLQLSQGSKGYIINNDSAIIAFKIGEELSNNPVFKIVGSHTDSPSFRIKSNPIMRNENIIKLNTEVYGGPILYTWMDRPLSIAGRVTVKGEDPFKPLVKLLNVNRDLLIIPSLAIHMNREVNKGFEFNPQKHTLPILSLDENEELNKNILEDLISRELKVNRDYIMDYDLYLYDRQKGQIIGLNNEFLSVGRQDNLSMVYTSLMAFVDENPKENINIFISTDNEEVGSRTIQGADSPFISNSLERIAMALGKNREDFLRMIENSFMISADMAHGVHPNFTGKADPTNRPKLGQGIVIKYAANKSYTSDSYSASIVKSLCKENDIKYQDYYNRSDARGGSTIGPITATQLNIRSCDVGGPILAMHSIRELGAVDDLMDSYRLFKALYS